jgi:hypothetical protein
MRVGLYGSCRAEAGPRSRRRDAGRSRRVEDFIVGSQTGCGRGGGSRKRSLFVSDYDQGMFDVVSLRQPEQFRGAGGEAGEDNNSGNRVLHKGEA